MALTRAMLKGMGLTEEQVSAIIDEHVNVTSPLKTRIGELEDYKEKAEKLVVVEKELNNLKKEIKENDWEGKYNKEHGDFENFKAEIATKEKEAKIKTAYKKLLTECKVGEKHFDAILRVTDFSNIKINDDGTLENADKLKETISSDWSGFVTDVKKVGADVETPPNDNNKDNAPKSRAAEIAAKYHDNLYGKVKED